VTWPAEVVSLVENAEWCACQMRLRPYSASKLDRQNERIVARLSELGVEINHPDSLKAMLAGAVVLLEALERKGRDQARVPRSVVNGFVAAVADCLPVEARP
jgi:hypothetical protein